MKVFIVWPMLIGFVLFATVACNQKKNTAGPPGSGDIITAYEAMGSDLTEDSLGQAKIHAGLLATATQKITDPNQQASAQTLIDHSKKLAAASDLEVARAEYEEISSAFQRMSTYLGYGGSKYYCSMLGKTWMQSDDTVKNPYGGKAMPECGEKVGE